MEEPNALDNPIDMNGQVASWSTNDLREKRRLVVMTQISGRSTTKT